MKSTKQCEPKCVILLMSRFWIQKVLFPERRIIYLRQRRIDSRSLLVSTARNQQSSNISFLGQQERFPSRFGGVSRWLSMSIRIPRRQRVPADPNRPLGLNFAMIDSNETAKKTCESLVIADPKSSSDLWTFLFSSSLFFYTLPTIDKFNQTIHIYWYLNSFYIQQET